MHIPGIAAVVTLTLFSLAASAADKTSREIQTPYTEPKVVYDFYFDSPEKINNALYWIR